MDLSIHYETSRRGGFKRDIFKKDRFLPEPSEPIDRMDVVFKIRSSTNYPEQYRIHKTSEMTLNKELSFTRMSIMALNYKFFA